jgi:20S proteasome alpha/beta subunit
MTQLKENYHGNLTIAEAEKLVLQTLKGNMEDRICKDNVEIMFIKTETKKWQHRTVAEIEELIQQLA